MAFLRGVLTVCIIPRQAPTLLTRARWRGGVLFSAWNKEPTIPSLQGVKLEVQPASGPRGTRLVFQLTGGEIGMESIVNSNEGVFLFSADYDRGIFEFLPPGDYRSYDNTIRGNIFRSNASVAIHLKDSTNHRITANTFLENGQDILTEGRDDGNSV